MTLTVQQTKLFAAWHGGLRDRKAQQVIAKRIIRVQSGLLGDVKPVGEGVSELRVDVGPGYRLYFTRRGQTLVILLCGGDKGSQQKDIEAAKALARNL